MTNQILNRLGHKSMTNDLVCFHPSLLSSEFFSNYFKNKKIIKKQKGTISILKLRVLKTLFNWYFSFFLLAYVYIPTFVTFPFLINFSLIGKKLICFLNKLHGYYNFLKYITWQNISIIFHFSSVFFQLRHNLIQWVVNVNYLWYKLL